jgi:hypothetical protein
VLVPGPEHRPWRAVRGVGGRGGNIGPARSGRARGGKCGLIVALHHQSATVTRPINISIINDYSVQL